MGFNIDSLPMKYWDIKVVIEYIQRRIIVYSIAYYELNMNLVSDKYFDEVSEQLVVLQNENKEVVKETRYGYVFYDFDGSTGFDLYHRLNSDDKQYLMDLTRMILYRKRRTDAKQNKVND